MPRADRYAGFNLLLSDNGHRFYLLSNGGDQYVLEDGVHAVSNGRMDELWPKTQGLRRALMHCQKPQSVSELCRLLEDTEVAPDETLPMTGVGIELERQLAPRLIVGDLYGTRSSSVLRLSSAGSLEFTEFTRGLDGHITGEKSVTLKLSPSAGVI